MKQSPLPSVREEKLRREQLKSRFADLRIDALLVTSPVNVRYLTGFTGSNGILLLSEGRDTLFTDPRYTLQASAETNCRVRTVKGPLLPEAGKIALQARFEILGFEASRIGYEEFTALKKDTKRIRLKPLTGAVEAQRLIKSGGEIALIRHAVDVNSNALKLALNHLKANTTEVDLAAELEYRMRRGGADSPSFDTIVAAGTRTALPHARPRAEVCRKHHLLLIDMGATVAGYASDMTRTYALGKLDGRGRRMYAAVLESQLAAIDAIRPGITCGQLDKIARRVLRKHGIDKLFIHSLGHGLGLEIHESPRIGRGVEMKLEPGMAITVEPGVYEESYGGVRIEDTVVVTSHGCEVLTPTPKDFTVL